MERVRDFIQKQVCLCSLLITLLSFGPMLIVSRASFDFNTVTYNVVIRFWPACILISVMKLLGLIKQQTFSFRGIGKGIAAGWLAILFSIGMLVVNLYYLPAGHEWLIPKGTLIAAYIFEMFCIGLLEEVLARGIIFQLMAQAWVEKEHGQLKAAILSGVFFGMMHLFNLIGGAGIYATCSQIIYAAFIGLYFAAVFVKTKNMWSVILLHAFIDLTGNFIEFFSNSRGSMATSFTDISPWQAVSNVIITVPFMLYAVITIQRQERIEVEKLQEKTKAS